MFLSTNIYKVLYPEPSVPMNCKQFIALMFPFFINGCFTGSVYAQSETHDFITYDTTVSFTGFGSWNVKISRPRNMFVAGNPDTASRPGIIFMVGVGEVGAGNFDALSYYGVHYWYPGKWDGGIQLSNGKHYPTLISVSPHYAWPSTRATGLLLEFLINKYHIRNKGVHLTGLSMGAMTWTRFINAQRSAGDETYMKMVTSITALQGQGNAYYDSLQHADYMLSGDVPVTDGYKAYGIWAKKYGGKFFGLEGTNDQRDVWKISQAMNDFVPGSAYFSYENIGDGKHCCWNEMYDPAHTNWTSAGTLGPGLTSSTYQANTLGTYKTGSSIFKWMLLQGDTTLIIAAPPGKNNKSSFIPIENKNITENKLRLG